MLATIVILLVILLIATPSIRGMLTKTNELSKSYIEELVLDAAREYVSVKNRDITRALKLVNDTKILSLNTLYNIGLIEEKDLNTLGSSARVLLTLLDNSNIKYEIVYNADLLETTKPEIILLGNNPHYVKQNSSFFDPGYIAIDKNGKIITKNVLVTGTINTSLLGSDVLRYSLIDDFGNVADEVTRTVIVVDSSLPTVTVATVASNNLYNNKFAKNGDTITLSLTFSKAVTNPTVKIGNITATSTTTVVTYKKTVYTRTCTGYCASNAFSCKTYNSCAACGCSTWDTSWSSWSSTPCTATPTLQCETQQVYQ